jgi:hypothetical protein
MAITIGANNQQIRLDDDIHKALDDGVNVRVQAGDTWTFPVKVNGADGQIGKLCVSQYRAADVPGTKEQLAVHVTFTINSIFAPSAAGAANSQVVRVEIVNLHFTARPKGVQAKIQGDNFVSAQPDNRLVATHRGELNDWLHNGNPEKGKAMAVQLGLSVDTPQQEAAARQKINTALLHYTGAALSAVRTAIVNALRVEINDNLMPANLRGKVPVEVRIS